MSVTSLMKCDGHFKLNLITWYTVSRNEIVKNAMFMVFIFRGFTHKTLIIWKSKISKDRWDHDISKPPNTDELFETISWQNICIPKWFYYSKCMVRCISLYLLIDKNRIWYSAVEIRFLNYGKLHQTSAVLHAHRWLSARLQYPQCVSNGDTAVLH